MIDSSSGSDLLGSLADDYLERLRHGERPPLTEYAEQYPQLAPQIRELFPTLLMMEQFGSLDRPLKGAAGLFPATPRRLGDYLIVREIGRGGMGIVYEAVQESLGRHVALKVLPAVGRHNSTQVGRFQREARTAARLHHTNIVSVYGVGEEAGTFYYAMQFIHGRTLDAVLQAVRRIRATASLAAKSSRNGQELAESIAQGLLVGQFSGQDGLAREPGAEANPRRPKPSDLLTPTGRHGAEGDLTVSGLGKPWVDSLTTQTGTQFHHSVARVGLQVAEALAYAHQQGVLHRDIKPSNLLLDSMGRVWVTDFGLAKAEDSEPLTRTGDFVGTLRYMAPERFRGQSGPRSDVYSLGVTLFELLTLRPAFDEGDRPRLIARIAREGPPSLRSLDPEVPRDLETIVNKAMAREPADRYSSADALAEDLQRFLSGRAILARSVGPAERLWRWSRRNPMVASLALAVAALLVLIATGMSVSAARSRVRAERESKLRSRAEKSEKELRTANFDLVRSLYFQRIALAQGALTIGNRDHAADLLEDGCPEQLRGWEWNYLRRSHSAEPWTVRGKTDVPISMSISPDSQRIVTPSLTKCNTLIIRDLASGREIRTLTGLAGPVRDVRFLPDGKHLVSASQMIDGYDNVDACEVATWDLESGKICKASWLYVGGWRYHFNVVFSNDGRTVAMSTLHGSQGALALHDVATGRLRWQINAHSQRINAVVFSEDGRFIATASEDQSVKIWEVSTGRALRTLRRGNEPMTSVTFSYDGTQIATASFYGTITVWETSTGRVQSTFLGHDTPVNGLAFHPDGHRLASVGEDGMVRVWYAETGHELLSLKGVPGIDPRVTFSPDGERLSATNWDVEHIEDGSVMSSAEIRVWDGSPSESRSKMPLLTLRGHSEGVVCLAFGPDHRSLASGGDDCTVRLWDLASGNVLAVLQGHEAPITRIAFTPDGSRLASATSNGVIRIWDVRTGQALQTLSETRDHGCVVNLAFSPNGSYLASSHEGHHGGVWIWDVMTGRQVHSLQGHSFGAWGAAFQEDGNRLVTIGGEAAAKTWDLASGQELQTIRLTGSIPHSGRSVAVAFSPDGSQVVRSTYDRTVAIWSLRDGRDLAILERNSNEAWSVEYSPDGRRIATAHWAKSKIWDTATGQLLLTLRGHTDRVRGVAFSPNGEHLASASMDKTVIVWRLPPLTEYLPLTE